MQVDFGLAMDTPCGRTNETVKNPLPWKDETHEASSSYETRGFPRNLLRERCFDEMEERIHLVETKSRKKPLSYLTIERISNDCSICTPSCRKRRSGS